MLSVSCSVQKKSFFEICRETTLWECQLRGFPMALTGSSCCPCHYYCSEWRSTRGTSDSHGGPRRSTQLDMFSWSHWNKVPTERGRISAVQKISILDLILQVHLFKRWCTAKAFWSYLSYGSFCTPVTCFKPTAGYNTSQPVQAMERV